MAYLTNFSFEFFYKIFTENASLLLLYHSAKKSKMTKNSNQGGSCLNARRKDRYQRRVKEFKFGFEHLLRKARSAGYFEVEETQQNELVDKELVQLGKLYEVFNFGKTLFSLQWPCDIQFFYVFLTTWTSRKISKNIALTTHHHQRRSFPVICSTLSIV